MILKKPYAFLIKYFKVIHFVIAALLCIIAYKFSSIVTFFNNYIKNGYQTTVINNLDKIYVPGILYFLILIIIILSLSILILLLHKEKPAKIYIFMVGYYLVVFLGLFYIASLLRSFSTSLLEATLSRSIRDVLFMTYIPQFLFIIFMFLRGFGFNVKKLNFADELREMDLTSKDNEEFELNINLPGYKADRSIRKTLRELYYYIVENKFLVIIISIIVVIVIALLIIFKQNKNYDNTYKINSTFMYNNMQVTISDSIITSVDYNGNTLKLGKFYVVVYVKLLNNTGSNIYFDSNTFKLNIDDNLYTPSVDFTNKFIDFVSGEVPKSVASFKEKVFPLIYEIDDSLINKSMKLEINNGTIRDNDSYNVKHIYVNLKPQKISNDVTVNNYRLETIVDFSDTYLKNTTFVINDYEFTNKYLYKYKACENDDCKEYSDVVTIPLTSNALNSKLLVLGVEYNQDLETGYSQENTTISSFIENFMYIQYKIGEDVKNVKVENLAPQTLKDHIVVAVPNEITKAEIIQVIIRIRNSKYIVNLKTY